MGLEGVVVVGDEVVVVVVEVVEVGVEAVVNSVVVVTVVGGVELLVVVAVVVVVGLSLRVSNVVELTLACSVVSGGNVGKSICTLGLSLPDILPSSIVGVVFLSLSIELSPFVSSSSSSSSKSASKLVRGVEGRLPSRERKTSGPATRITWAMIRFTIPSICYKITIYVERKSMDLFLYFSKIFEIS